MYVVTDHALPEERLSSRSDAAIIVLKDLGGAWAVLAVVVRALPAWLRNWGYNVVARDRYRIFGKYDSCPIPNEKDRHKFLDLS
jgi:predicted DCC family thiol-disulfide oxidoreductase YuxK